MDDLIEHIARALLGFLRLLVAVVWASIEWAYEKALWWIGWPIFRVITFGNYPKEGFSEQEKATMLTQSIVCLAGFFLPIAGLYYLARLFGP